MTDKALFESESYVVERATEHYTVKNKNTGMVEAEDRRLPYAITIAKTLESFLSEALSVDTKEDETTGIPPESQFLVPQP